MSTRNEYRDRLIEQERTIAALIQQRDALKTALGQIDSVCAYVPDDGTLGPGMLHRIRTRISAALALPNPDAPEPEKAVTP